MANSVADVVIVGATWTDLYAATGIAVGTAVDVYNKGNQGGQLAVKATIPTINNIGIPLFATSSEGGHAYVSGNPSGLWFYCASPSGTILSVQA